MKSLSQLFTGSPVWVRHEHGLEVQICVKSPNQKDFVGWDKDGNGFVFSGEPDVWEEAFEEGEIV